MNYTSEFDGDVGVCTVRVNGAYERARDTLALQDFARAQGEDGGWRLFLFDMRQAEIEGTWGDIFRAGTVPNDKDARQLNQKVALVYSEISDKERFLEEVTRNRGYSVRIFVDADLALNWLKSS